MKQNEPRVNFCNRDAYDPEFRTARKRRKAAGGHRAFVAECPYVFLPVAVEVPEFKYTLRALK